jgi:hypothetical protein
MWLLKLKPGHVPSTLKFYYSFSTPPPLSISVSRMGIIINHVENVKEPAPSPLPEDLAMQTIANQNTGGDILADVSSFYHRRKRYAGDETVTMRRRQ